MSEMSLPFAPVSASAPARVFIMAELGVNHDGKIDRALALVDMARQAGADAVKLQLFQPERLLSAQARLAAYQEGTASDPVALLEKLTLSLDQLSRLRRAAGEAGLHFIVTPFSLPDVADLSRLNVDAVKIASPDAVNTPLLDAAMALAKPMFVSTGTCELEELAPAAERLTRHRAGGALLQCVSSYPTADEAAALGAIEVLGARFDLPVGYSDHTAAVDSGALAVAASACVLEKHLTYDPEAAGPDHAASLGPEDFGRYVSLARRAAAMLGPRVKRRLKIEQDVADVSRQSLAATRDLSAGHLLAAGDLTPMRPGTGIPAAVDLIGRKLAKAVKARNLIAPGDLADAPTR